MEKRADSLVAILYGVIKVILGGVALACVAVFAENAGITFPMLDQLPSPKPTLFALGIDTTHEALSICFIAAFLPFWSGTTILLREILWRDLEEGNGDEPTKEADQGAAAPKEGPQPG